MPKEYPCTEPGCGKSFLRPEHLSRHRLNRKSICMYPLASRHVDPRTDRPKQIYQCPSCPKRFVRKDLLRRHEKRHEKGMWFRNSGGYTGPSPMQDASPDPPQRSVREPAAMFTVENDDVRGVPTASSEKSHDDADDDTADKGDHPVSHDQQAMVPMDFRNDMINPLTDDHVASLFFDPSFNIPDPSLDFEWLFDNISADFNSANGGLPVVSPQSSASAAGISPPSFPMQSPHIRSPASSHSSSSSPWVAVRANLLTALNTLAPDILMSSFFYPSNLAHFYDLYFENYHPHFPILHKPTLDPMKAPPLLIAAIVTLGSTLSSDAAHFETSIKIHDSLRYIIFNVSSIL